MYDVTDSLNIITDKSSSTCLFISCRGGRKPYLRPAGNGAYVISHNRPPSRMRFIYEDGEQMLPAVINCASCLRCKSKEFGHRSQVMTVNYGDVSPSAYYVFMWTATVNRVMTFCLLAA